MIRAMRFLKVIGAATLLCGVAMGCGDDEGTVVAGGTTGSSSGGSSTGGSSTGGSSTGGSNTGGSNTGGSNTGGGGGGGGGGGSNNQTPVASFTMTPECTMASTTEITFTSTSTDPDVGDTLTCSWAFSSGTPASSTECTQSGVTFPNVAPYAVTLTVNDGVTTDQATMNIAPCPPPP